MNRPTTQDTPRTSAALAAILILTVAVHLPTLNITFINDDISYIRFTLKGPAPHFFEMFSELEVAGVYYRPLVSVSFGLDYLMWGWDALGYRITNLVLHLFNVVLVYLLGRRLLNTAIPALLGAAFFGVLPIHELSVFWLPGRTDVLCSLFYLVSLLIFMIHMERGGFRLLALSCLFFVFALLSKEMALSLPLVVMLVTWRKEEHRTSRPALARALRTSIPFLGVALFVIVARWITLDNNVLFGEHGLHGNISFLHIIKNISSYIGLLIVPAGHFEIEQVLSTYPAVFIITAVLCVFIVIMAGWKFGRQHPEVLFFTLWILVTLLPVSRLMMRWYLYIPSVGFCLGLGWLVAQLGKKRIRHAVIAGSLVWLLYAGITLARATEWVEGSQLADRLFDGLVAQMDVLEPGDTLTFATIPAKSGTTPLFHLGLEARLKHHFRIDSLTAVIWSRTIMDQYPAAVQWEMSGGDVRLKAQEGAYFHMDHDDYKTRRVVPRPGQTVRIENFRVSVLALNASNKPDEILCLPDDTIGSNLFSFDGEKFVRIR